MPYKVRFVRGAKKPWKIIKKSTGEVVGSSTTRELAEKSIAARYISDNQPNTLPKNKTNRLRGI